MPLRIVINTLEPGVAPADYETWLREYDYRVAKTLASIASYRTSRIEGPIKGAEQAGWRYIERIDAMVHLGTHGTLEEFLDKGRSGMASTFLTRLRVGSKLVDAKGVSMLYRSRISTWSLLFLVLGFYAIEDDTPLHPWVGLLQRILVAVWLACTIVMARRALRVVR